MAERQQVVILAITYDPDEADPPEQWNWAELLECDPEHVNVLMSGGLVTTD